VFLKEEKVDINRYTDIGREKEREGERARD